MRALHWRRRGEIRIVLCLMNSLCLLVPVLVNVAFVTLFERKILGLAQSRKGPNKVLWGGVGQPFADAVKLFAKSWASPLQGLPLLFLGAPAGALVLALLGWQVIPSFSAAWPMKLRLLWLLVVLGLGLYPLLLAGWASNRGYASLGALRGVSQTIAYEVSLALILLRAFCVSGLPQLAALQTEVGSLAKRALVPLWLLWLITCVAETNRTPFDFAEGESELVSGFNVEYAAGGFVLIFMAEYARILLLSALSSYLVLLSPSGLANARAIVAVAGGWIWLRATLPRYRYDKLINLAWKRLLPEALFLLFLFAALSGL